MMFKVLFILIAIVLFNSCEPVDNRLTIINRTGSKLYYFWQNDNLIQYSDYCVESLANHKLRKENTNFVLPNDSSKIIITEKKYWDWYLGVDSPDGKIRLYFIDSFLLDYYSFSNIIKNKKYKRLQYSLKQLNDLNFKIVIKNDL